MLTNETHTGQDPTVTVTVTGLNRTFDWVDSEQFDDPAPDWLDMVARALPTATTTDPD